MRSGLAAARAEGTRPRQGTAVERQQTEMAEQSHPERMGRFSDRRNGEMSKSGEGEQEEGIVDAEREKEREDLEGKVRVRVRVWKEEEEEVEEMRL